MRGVLLSSLAAHLGPFLSALVGASLPERLGPALSVFLTAALFAVIHDPVRLLFAFVLGLVFGLVRLRSASLWPSVVIHATLNSAHVPDRAARRRPVAALRRPSRCSASPRWPSAPRCRWPLLRALRAPGGPA